jgi:tRNA A-37 threonylcarbamoyl transferase component Bud32
VSRVAWRAGDPRVYAAVESALAGAAPHAALRVLHDNPRRRLLRVESDHGALLAKHFKTASGRHAARERVKRWLGRSPASREWRHLVHARAAGAPVPEPLALGRLPEGDEILVTRFVEGELLADALRVGAPARRERLRAVGRAVAKLHAAGLEHRDLHAGNILVGSGGATLLDLQHARRHRGEVGRARDLGQLDYSLWRLASATDRLRLAQAALAPSRHRAASDRERLRAVARAARARADAHARSRTRRALHEGRLHARARVNDFEGLRLRDLDARDLEAALAAHREALGAALLEADARSRVSAVRAGERAAIVKEYPARGLARAIADAVRGSPARRGWQAGHGLLARGIGAARPLAYLERRVLGVPVRSLFVMEDVRPAPDALAAVHEKPADALDALVRLVVALHRRGVDHGDLKATNVFLRGGPRGLDPLLVDLEGVRFRRALGEARRVQALAELNASLPDVFPAELRRAAFARYARAHPFAEGSARALRRVVEASLARRHRFQGRGCKISGPRSSAAP